MGESANDFFTQYQQMLESYLTEGGEGPLHHAYELGRRALSEGMGLLDLTYIHQSALEAVIRDQDADIQLLRHQVLSASRFLDEALSPFEVSRLSSKDANNALRRLYDVLEEESKRIAHILHDESAQMLATIYLELSGIAKDSSAAIAERVNQVVKHLDEVREQLRGLSHELRPLILDQLGLIPALRFLSNGVNKRYGLDIQVTGDTGGRLYQAIETVLYRTVQEGLNNVTRHAQATRVEVDVWIDENMIFCVIKDNGVGFEMPDERKNTPKGLGLVGVKERVGALRGDFNISSSPGEGTEMRVAIPL